MEALKEISLPRSSTHYDQYQYSLNSTGSQTHTHGKEYSRVLLFSFCFLLFSFCFLFFLALDVFC